MVMLAVLDAMERAAAPTTPCRATISTLLIYWSCPQPAKKQFVRLSQHELRDYT